MNDPEPKTGVDDPLRILIPKEELGIRTFVQMFRAFHRISRRLENLLESQGLSLAQFELLATLRFGEGITQQELAERLLVTKGNVCGLLDRAGAAGYVERRPDPQDRRANRLYLTDKGRAVVDKTMPEHHGAVNQMLAFVGEEELESLYRIFKRIGDETSS